MPTAWQARSRWLQRSPGRLWTQLLHPLSGLPGPEGSRADTQGQAWSCLPDISHLEHGCKAWMGCIWSCQRSSVLPRLCQLLAISLSCRQGQPEAPDTRIPLAAFVGGIQDYVDPAQFSSCLDPARSLSPSSGVGGLLPTNTNQKRLHRSCAKPGGRVASDPAVLSGAVVQSEDLGSRQRRTKASQGPTQQGGEPSQGWHLPGLALSEQIHRLGLKLRP